MKEHNYKAEIRWTGNLGTGTSKYEAYSRDHEIRLDGKPVVAGSSDPVFRGDPARWNPEEMLLASLSACHMLWYLHLCAVNRVVVVAYEDSASGVMVEDEQGSGRFTAATLRPAVTITAESDADTARALHEQAHRLCFIANSVNFPVGCEPAIGKLIH